MQPHSVCSDFFVALACHFPQPAPLIYLGNMENLPKKIRERWESVWFKLFKGVTTRRTNGFCSTGLPLASVVFQRILFLGMLGVKSGVVE